MNISIISDCNNKCEFCFQKDYHSRHQKLTFDEIREIYRWGAPYRPGEAIGILGGEPTMHPDILKIFDYLHGKMYLMSNLLCDTSITEAISDHRMSVLINSVHSVEDHEIFLKNLEIFERNFPKTGIAPAIGITLYDDEAENDRMIQGLIEYKKKFPNITRSYRIGLAVPYAKEFRMVNYDKRMRELLDTFKDCPEITFNFDCPANECQISHAMKEELRASGRFSNRSLDGTYCRHGGICEVCTDKKVIHCFAIPEDLWTRKYYYEYKNRAEFTSEMLHKEYEYYKENLKICQARCHSKTCKGGCMAILERMKRSCVSK